MQDVRWSGFWASTVAIVLFITTLAALPSFGAGAVASGTNPPLGVHLSYLDDPTAATITWYTAGATSSRAEWGRSIGPPYPFQKAGDDYASPGGTHLHVVNLTGLTPGATYFYRIGDASMTSTFGQATFRAAPPKGASDTFTFAAAGDWGDTVQPAVTSSWIAKRNPTRVLPVGDLYYKVSESNVTRVYNMWQAFGAGSFVQSGMGNHEEGGSTPDVTPLAVHCAYSNLPGNERTYAFTFGNTYFVTLDFGADGFGQADGVDGSLQGCDGVAGTAAIRAWVDAKLAAADADPLIRWIVVYFHFMCYDMTTQGFSLLCPIDSPNDQIEDILTNRHVDLVLTGHDHIYGRTYPVHFQSVTQTGNAYHDPGAPIYLIVGTGGASGTGTCRTSAWVAACRVTPPAKGFGWFQVSPTLIKYEFVESSSGVIDSFTLTKTPSAGFAVSADPSAVRVQPGGTASSAVTVLGSSADAVSLGLSGRPPGAPCSVSPSSGSPPFTSSLSITTFSSTPVGNFRITVVASNASSSARAPFDVTVAQRFTQTYQRDGGGISETDDATIDSGAPGTNTGTATTLRVDGMGCNGGVASRVCKVLLKFPQIMGPNSGQIPIGATVVSATLQLYISDNPGITEDLYQTWESWNEATVTWNSFATPGSPQKGGVVLTFFPTAPGWVSLNVTYVVQKWAEGDPNQGFFLTSTNGDAVVYASSDYPNLDNRPTHCVTYYAPAAPELRDPRAWPFFAESIWNLPIGASASYVPAGIAQATAYGMTTDGDVLILNSSAPITPVYLNSDAWTGRSRCDIQGGVLFEAPISPGFVVPGANPTFTPNHAVAILDADGKTLIQGQPYTHCTADGPITMWWFQEAEQLDGTGVSGGHGGSKLSSIGGTIRLGELVPGGMIRHAMKVNLDAHANLFFDTSTGGFRWPATVADFCAPTCYGGTNPALRMGSLLALPPGFDVSSLETDAARILARGFVDYGAYVVDNTGWSVYGLATAFSTAGSLEQEFARSWGFSMTPASKDVPWARDMDRIFGALNVVDNWNLANWQTVSASGGTLGAGLGATRTAWAPPLLATPTPSPFDFSLSTSPSSGFTPVHGGSVSATVTAQRTFGPTHSVQYSCTNLPAGATCSFTPTACSTTCTANLILATSSSTPPGTYAVIVQATDGPVTRTSGFTLTVGDPLLAYDMETLTGSGLMKDLSGHGNDGTITGTTDVVGKVGRARQFDGVDDNIAASVSVGGQWTIALWVQWNDGPNTYEHPIGLGTGHDATFWFSGTTVAFKTQDASGTTVVDRRLSSSITTGIWYHLAATFDGTTVKGYLDGVQACSASAAATTIRSSNIKIGSSGYAVNNFFDGIIDEVLIYNRALTAEEIAALAPPPPPRADGLALSYDMETLTGGLMKDLSGHGHHGMIKSTREDVGTAVTAAQFN